MHRFLPLLFLFAACSGDPLELHVADVDSDLPTDGLTAVDYEAGASEIIPAHEDLNLKLSFRADEGAKADLMIQGKYKIELPAVVIPGTDQLLVTDPTPGVWHDLEIVFIAAKDGAPAILPAVYLDGGLVYYQLEPGANDAPAGPLTLEVNSGTVEVTNVRKVDQSGKGSYIAPGGEVMLQMPLMRYEYYDLPDNTVDFTDYGTLEPMKTGYVGRYDLNGIMEKGRNYAIRFFGKLNVPKAGEYKFTTYTPAAIRFYVDGRMIIQDPGRHDARNIEGSIELGEGVHDVQLDLVQNDGWNVVEVRYTAPGEDKPQWLNTMARGQVIATPAAATPNEVKTDDYPYLLRSFLFFPVPRPYDEAAKRTHVISVGEGEGPHYSLDLQNGAILQVWRGRFADTHDMWDGRGEPQVMRPLGPGPALDGSPQWAELSGDNDAWPDTLKTGRFHHVRHTLDEAGRPTFEYEMDGGHRLTDKLTPTDGGLVRELTHTAGGNATLYTRVAAAREITEIAPGEYELKGPGMKVSISSYDGSRLVLQKSNGMQRLVAEMPATGHLTYSMNW